MTPIFRVSQSYTEIPCLDNQLVAKECFNGNKSFQLDGGI